MLADDWVARFYGMTNQVLPILALDGARDRFPTQNAKRYGGKFSKTRQDDKRKDGALWAMAPLASAMRASWAPDRQTAIAAASEGYVVTFNANIAPLSEPREVSLEKNMKQGLNAALTYLPTSGRLGSAARFDPLG